MDLLEKLQFQEIIISIPGNGWSLKEDHNYCLNYNYYYKKGRGIIREVSPY